MTKSELKKMMKPIVKECIQEMMLQEGMLSTLVREVVKGQNSVIQENVQRTPMTVARTTPVQTKQAQVEKPKISEARRRLADSIGKGAYGDIFENVEPAPDPNVSQDIGDPGLDLSILSNIPGLESFKVRK